MPLELFNTLSAKVEEFHPLEDNLVRMYACGPTVYDYAHIGNFRYFVVVDSLRRFLRQSGYRLKHVMNITDVDDKIIRNAARDGVTVQEYTKKYRAAFLEDADSLNIEHPELLVNATDHIQEMAHFIAQLVEKGYAYRTDDGSYYFRIAKFPEYGKLSKKDFAGMTDGARVDVDEYDKDNARDFALWKAPKPGEASWDTEIGPGRPGWHIECSTMSMKYLGETFDIHLGGEDLIFPHHENEIAQSEAETGKKFVNVWVHSRFLLVEGEKMAKSAGNFYTVRDLVLMGHKPSSIRFLLMSVPHSKQLNFTFDGLTQAANSVERLRNFKRRLQTEQFPQGTNNKITDIAAKTSEELRAALNDNLNTARALGAIFDMVRDVNAAADAGEVRKADVPALLKVLEQFEEIFPVLKDDDAGKVRSTVEWARSEGLEAKISPETLDLAKAAALSDDEVERLVAEHSQARKARDFARSDAIRAELAANGIILENTKDGVRWKRK
ncbi:MAG: cysteine--tRNA ligase [Candidatus Korobacteraceae bacterium]